MKGEQNREKEAAKNTRFTVIKKALEISGLFFWSCSFKGFCS